MLKPLLLVIGLSAAAGCVPNTVFRGSPHFPGGPGGCYAACEQNGMDMSSFVFSGEFATSCVCRARPATPAATAPVSGSTTDDEAAAVGAAVGVARQMEQQQQDDAARQPRMRR